MLGDESVEVKLLLIDMEENVFVENEESISAFVKSKK